MHVFKKPLNSQQTLVLGFLALSAVLLIVDFFRQPAQGFLGYRLMMGSLLGLMVILALATVVGYVRTVASIYLALVFAALVYVALQLNGVHSVTIAMFLILILMAIPLLGWLPALGITLLAILVTWVLAFLPIPVTLPPPEIQARNISIIFGATFLLIWWYSRQLQAVAKQLREANALLESRVKERTSQVLVSEKLATVGRLSAGLAHELNTPLGAVLSSHSTASRVAKENLASAFAVLWELTAQNRATVETVITRIFHEDPTGRWISAVDQRARRKMLEEWVSASPIPEHLQAAVQDDVLDLPIDDRDEFERIASCEQSERVFGALIQIQDLARSLDIIGRGSRTMALVVSSFQSLSRKSTDAPPMRIDTKEEFESVLVLLHNRIPSGVKIVRVFGDRVHVLCRPGRLGQVLVNLITNALHAMATGGVMTVTTRIEGDWGVLEVSDTGSGVPEALRESIFEPFFTTKAPADGNGLGLDLSRGICQEEGGSLVLEHAAHPTTFTVRLPLFHQQL